MSSSPALPALQPTEKERSGQAMFDRMWSALGRSPLLDTLNHQAFGVDYPYDISFFSSCSRTILDRVLACLQLSASGTLVDLGCGSGGPGQWIARQSGTRVIGIDLSREALAGARAAALTYLPNGRFDYLCGTITATGLPDGSVDGLMSIDALPIAADRAAALCEVFRVLRPGGRAMFTCAEWRGDDPLPHPRMATRWAPLIEDAGLNLVEEFIDRGKQVRQLRLYDLWLTHQDELRRDLGDVAELLLEEARMGPTLLTPSYTSLLLTVEKP